MKVFIIHGSFGFPEEGWFPWLAEKLRESGYTVEVPQFPVEEYDDFKKRIEADASIEPHNQNLQNWLEAFQPYLEQITADTIFIGHSLGPAFILRILERIDVRVKACVFASGFIDMLPGFPQFNSVNKTFIKPSFDWDKIKQQSDKFICLGGDDDPYVPPESLEKFAGLLDVNLEIIPNGGHLSAGSGMTEFPRMLEVIKDFPT